MNESFSGPVLQPDTHFGIRQPKVLEILKYPDSTLNKVSMPVLPGSNITLDQLKETLDDMVATMQANRAVGLAGIQIGVPLQMLVVQDQRLVPVKVVNPRLVEVSGHSFELEGCLSFPGLFLRVKRPESVVVEYLDENLEKCTTAADELLGRAIQHEMDHLLGKTFLDRISSVERTDALRKLKLAQRKRKALVRQLTGGR